MRWIKCAMLGTLLGVEMCNSNTGTTDLTKLVYSMIHIIKNVPTCELGALLKDDALNKNRSVVGDYIHPLSVFG